jgi:hypothetical protein
MGRVMACSSSAEILTAVGTLIAGAGAAVAAYAGIQALGAWHKQLHGQTRFDTAKRLLIAAHDLAEQFYGARNPFTLSSEYPPGYTSRPASEVTPKEKAAALEAVFQKRWEPVRVRCGSILGLLPETRALLSADVYTAARELLQVALRLKMSMGEYIEYELDADDSPQMNAERRRVRRDVYGTEPKAGEEASDNPLTKDFVARHEALVNALRPYVDMHA